MNFRQITHEVGSFCRSLRDGVALVASAVIFSTVAGPVAHAELKDLAQPAGRVSVSAPTLERLDSGATRFSLNLSQPLDRQVFELREPARLVIDLPEVEWNLAGEGAPAMDFAKFPEVEKLRVGLFRPGRSRLVLDLSEAPASLSEKVTAHDAGGAKLVIDLNFGVAPIDGAAADPEPRAAAASAELTLAAAQRVSVRPRPRPRTFTVVLDPGHGGHDSGANSHGLREKDIVLSVAKLVRRELERDPLIRVVMTRETDHFVPLPGRVEVTRDSRADLFISLHADSLPNHPEVGGASIYTLSERASDSMAARLARSENAADRLAGIADAPRERDIRDIVLDYKRRMVMGESSAFAESALGALQRNIKLIRTSPHRQANFHVLRSFNAPSVLVELGFLTNLKDRRRLGNPAWQETAAKTLADAIRRWARRDEAGMRMARAMASP